MQREQKILENIFINEINERGYGVGVLNSGREINVMNALPGETVDAKVIKRKKKILVGEAIKIQNPNQNRISQEEEHYMSSSPLQIITYDYENEVKKELIKNFYTDRADTELPDFELFCPPEEQIWHYRNKVEFSLYGDDNGIRLAYRMRENGFFKIPITSCKLIPKKVNEVADKIVHFLTQEKFMAKQFKGLMLRYSFKNQKVIAALYCKDEVDLSHFPFQKIENDCQSFLIIYSTPKSPAFVETSMLHSFGSESDIEEEINGYTFYYPYDSFFQINPPAFAEALQDMEAFIPSKEKHEAQDKQQRQGKVHVEKEQGTRAERQLISYNENKQAGTGKRFKIKKNNKTLVDLYAGVGVIGIYLAKYFNKLIGIELFEKSKEYAIRNYEANIEHINQRTEIADTNQPQRTSTQFDFVVSESEKAGLDYLEQADYLVLDPPRVGLHKKVIERILETRPEYIVYLSCNPLTQADNYNELKHVYEILFFKAYNFYPRTPHVESLIILKRISR